MFAALCEIGPRAVRVDWGYDSDPDITARWLERLLAAGFDILLHLVQSSDQASRMTQPEAQRRWGDFLAPIFAKFACRIRQFEIGSTPNRHSWSGYSLRDYVAACRIAQDLADQFGAQIVGPNVSDFAPYFTVGLLDACRRNGVRFSAMTDNLFVDRAGAPEAFDPSVAGKLLRDRAKMDLVGKEAVLKTITRSFGIESAYCTYTYYTLSLTGRPRSSRKRPGRYTDPDTYADYLVRYFTLSAAAGALDRVYWGNLAGHFKGLLDDGYPHRPDPPTVHHEFYNYGRAQDYARRPAFAAFRTVVAQLQGARFVAAPCRRGPFLLQFERDGRSVLVAWSAKPNGEKSDLVAEWIANGAQILSRDGEPLAPQDVPQLGPSPVYLVGE